MEHLAGVPGGLGLLPTDQGRPGARVKGSAVPPQERPSQAHALVTVSVAVILPHGGVGLLLPRSFISSSGWGPLSEPSRSGVKGVTEGTGEGPLGFQEVSLWGHTESDTTEAT